MAGFTRPSAYVRRMGLRRGLLGANRGWMIAGGAVWGAGVVRRMVRRREETVATETLRAGQTVTIRAIAPASRAERRAARRS